MFYIFILYCVYIYIAWSLFIFVWFNFFALISLVRNSETSITNMKSVVLSKLFMANVYELYTTICWDIRKYSLRYINGVYNQEKALMSLSTGSRLPTSVLDYWFYHAARSTLMFPRYRSLYRHPDRLP